MARIEPRTLKGFRDYLPEVMVPRVRMLRRIAEVFERFGFEPLDTPSLEYAEILLGKLGPEAEKLFYRFKDHGDRDVALRYELTISLARVVAQYPELPRPFKRYQMGPVWRAESPARGRYREFWQCDVDIVGSESVVADAECIAIDHAIMTALGVPNYRIRFNNRKVFRGLQALIGVADQAAMDAVLRAIDKFDKIGLDGVTKELSGLIGQGGFSDMGLQTVLDFLKIKAVDNNARLAAMSQFLQGTEHGNQGCEELRQVMEAARQMGVPDHVLQLDPSIVRGLDYYTGTVFETFLQDLPGLGSVMSGGRYDGLIGLFSSTDAPAVGISVGIDRLLSGLEELKLLGESHTSAQVLVTVFDEASLSYSLRAATALRQQGINAELWLEAGAKLQKQMKYAGRKGIPTVLIAGPDEQAAGEATLKTMATGQQRRMRLEMVEAAINGQTPGKPATP